MMEDCTNLQLNILQDGLEDTMIRWKNKEIKLSWNYRRCIIGLEKKISTQLEHRQKKLKQSPKGDKARAS